MGRNDGDGIIEGGESTMPKELEVAGPNGPDMWLLYPPLAGKHLRVAPVDGKL